MWQAGIGEGGSRQIGLSVLRGSSEEAFALAPTAVVIVENSKLISEYSVTALPQPDRLAIGIVIPRILSRADEYRMATEAGLNKCLEVKPSGDLWVLDRYHCGEQTETETEPSVSMNDPAEDPILLKHLRLNRGFLREPEIIAKLIPGPGHRDKTSADLEASMEKVMSTVARASAARHVIVCLDPEDEFKESRVEGLVRAAKDDGFSIDGVAADSVRGAETFRQVCDATGGVLRLVPAAQVAEALPELYQSLRNRFQICYQNADAPENRKVDIDIYTPQGSGKLHLELPEKG